MGSNGVFITTSQWNQFVYNYQMQECKLINLRGQYTILNQQLEDQKQKHQELQRHLVCMESKRSTSRADTTNSTSKSRTKWRIQHRILSIVNELLYGQYDLNKTETLALFDTILKERFNGKYPLEECLSSVHSVKEALLWMGTGGNRDKLKQRQTIISCSTSVAVLDDEYTVANKTLLHLLLPHTRKRRSEIIEECEYLRVLFDIGDADDLYKNYAAESRNRIPLAIKESVRLKFENVSLPHPSLTVIARDCNGTIMYDEKGDKQRIGKRLFTMNINDIFEEWMDEQRDLIIDYLYARNKKCICYGYFCRLR
eukprot:1067938_1